MDKNQIDNWYNDNKKVKEQLIDECKQSKAKADEQLVTAQIS